MKQRYRLVPISLLDAVNIGNLELVHKILGEFDGDVDDVGGFSPLRAAAFQGMVEIVELLLRNGADPLVNNKDGKFALDFAREGNHDKIIESIEHWLSS